MYTLDWLCKEADVMYIYYKNGFGNSVIYDVIKLLLAVIFAIKSSH